MQIMQRRLKQDSLEDLPGEQKRELVPSPKFSLHVQGTEGALDTPWLHPGGLHLLQPSCLLSEALQGHQLRPHPSHVCPQAPCGHNGGQPCGLPIWKWLLLQRIWKEGIRKPFLSFPCPTHRRTLLGHRLGCQIGETNNNPRGNSAQRLQV